MSQSYIIEVGDIAVGLVLRSSQNDRYSFVASDHRLSALDGQSFQRPAQAELAARSILTKRGSRQNTLGQEILRSKNQESLQSKNSFKADLFDRTG